MAYDIGTARGVIEMEYNGRGIDQATEDLDGLEKKGGNATRAAEGTAKGMQRAGLVIAAGFGAGVAAAANFEARLSAIKAVSGASASEMDKISEKALQLGKDTSFSAGESAQAMEELIKAGLSVDDVLNGAADATVALAAAGEVDMPTAATIASNAMNQFGLAAEDMVGVVDNIAGAANASAIDVGDFGQSLSQVGAVANLAGVSFEDTATAIAIMGNAGIKGSDAGTSLKSMFQRLQPTTKKQSELMKELGLITEDGSNKFYDAQGNTKSLAQVSQVLQNSLKGMTAQQKQAALQVLFGSDAIRGAAILADSGAKGFNKMSDAMGKVSAADVAATRLDNFKGSLEQMMGSLETLGITVGTLLLPPLRDLIDTVTAGMNAFLNLGEGTQKFILAAVGVAGAVLLIGAQLIKLIVWGQKVQLMLAGTRLAFIGTWAAALGPIALVIAAVAALVIVIVLLWKKSETFRNIVIGVWNAIKAAAMAVVNWFMGTLVPSFATAWQQLQTGLTAVKNFFVAIWNGIVAVVRTIFNVIRTIIQTYINIWVTVIRTGLAVLRAIWGAIWGTFGGIIKGVFNLIVAIIKLAWAIIKGIFIIQLRGLLVLTRAVWNAIMAVIRTVWNVIKAVVRTGVAAVRAVVTAAWNGIKAVTNAIWNGVMAVIRAVWGKIGGTVKSAASAVRNAVVDAWNAVKSATSSMWNAVVGVIRDKVGEAVNAVSGLKDRIVGFFSGAGSWLVNAGREIIQGLISGIESMLGALTSKISSATAAVKRFLPGSPVKEGPLKVLNHGYAGKQIVQMVIDGIETMQAPLAATMDDVITVPTGYAAPPPGSTPPPASGGAGGDSGQLRLIDGELRLDESGRAFIRGVAVEVSDADSDYDALLGRMGG